MVRGIVKNNFTINKESIKKYGEIKAIQKNNAKKENSYEGNDIIECSEEMGLYLEKENNFTKEKGKPLIEIIEIIPNKKEKKEEVKKEEIKKETKKTSKTTKTRKVKKESK